jgi:AraC-like DNA-binding protein
MELTSRGRPAFTATVNPLIIQLSCIDPIELEAVMDHWSFRVDKLLPGAFRGAAAVLRLNPLLIAEIHTSTTAAHRLRCPPHSRTLLIRGRGTGTTFIGGLSLQHPDFVLLDPGTAIDVVCQGGGSVICISLSGPANASFASSAGQPLPASTAGARLLSWPGVALNELPGWIDKAVLALVSKSTPEQEAVTGAILARELHLQLTVALANAVPTDAKRLRATRRRVAVERARKFIRNNLSESMRLADLCRHAHVQERSLEYGFREVVGLRPMGYIRMLRLAEVHRQLLADGVAARSISEVALDTGFCHLGQFAYDYKNLFMESPSDTLKRADFLRRAHGRCAPRAAGRAAATKPPPGLCVDPPLNAAGRELRKYLL